MIWGPVASEISQDRGNGVLKGMEEVEGFTANIIYEGYGDFQREKAYAEVERALIAYPGVEVIVGMNSVMALGSMSALEADGKLDDVLVTGMGGQPDELEMVARGKIGVAVFPRSAQHGREHRKRPDHAPRGAGGGHSTGPLYGSADAGFDGFDPQVGSQGDARHRRQARRVTSTHQRSSSAALAPPWMGARGRCGQGPTDPVRFARGLTSQGFPTVEGAVRGCRPAGHA